MLIQLPAIGICHSGRQEPSMPPRCASRAMNAKKPSVVASRRQWLALAAGTLAAAGVRPAADGSPIEHRKEGVRTSNHNDANLHLFVDDALVERRENLERFINRPRKAPSPVIVADQPWEGERAQAWGSVIVEPDGLLRIWYFAFNTERKAEELDRGGYAYAESRDGLNWRKPALGVVEFRGSKQNNLFYTCAPDGRNLVDEELARRGVGLPALDAQGTALGVLNNLDGLTVVRDDDEPDPARRYKLIANMQDHRMWAPYYKEKYPNVTDAQVQAARGVFGQYVDTSPDGIHWARSPRKMLGSVGDYMMVMRDYRNHRWWLNERAQGNGGRNAALRESADLANWGEPKIIFDNEEESGFGRLWEWHGGMTPFNYGNLNLGLLEKWPATGMGANCELICQREGQKWQRVAPGVPFLDVGPEGAFDRALAYPTHNPPIRIDDTLYIFYTGGGARTDARKGIPMSIGVAMLRLDRFAGLANWRPRSPGMLITRPFTIAGKRLSLNVESFELNPIRAALSTPLGEFLPGHGFDDSQIDYDARRVYTEVRWRENRNVAHLSGKAVKLHVELKGAALYSFRLDG
jgi:hypothetical protein